MSIKRLAGIAISQMTGLSENAVSNWKIFIHTRFTDWLLANPCPLGGPGVVVKLDSSERGNTTKVDTKRGCGYLVELTETQDNA